jgi:F420H(2)-dependent quinone reductase
MPLTGKYEPSQNDRTREQVELYEATNGVKGGTLNGKPVIVLTFKGAKSGKIRKTPLMRIEHNGTHAVVASNASAPTHPLWYRNIVADPLVELQDGAVRYEMRAREVFGEEKNEWWTRAGRRLFGIPRLSGPSRPQNSGARPGSSLGRYPARRGLIRSSAQWLPGMAT